MSEEDLDIGDFGQTLVDGVRSIELKVRGMREISTGRTVFFQSKTQLNTPDLGTLMPEEYREVAEATQQADELFELEFIQAMEIFKSFKERDISFQWISIYMPARVLMMPQLERNLMLLLEKEKCIPAKFCFSLSTRILDETDENIFNNIKKLRNRGFHFLLEDFGAKNCPIMKLSAFEVDFVLLHREITQFIGKSERSNSAVESVVGFITTLGASVIADGVRDGMQAKGLSEVGCDYVAGPLAGLYMNEKEVKKPKTGDEEDEE